MNDHLDDLIKHFIWMKLPYNEWVFIQDSFSLWLCDTYTQIRHSSYEQLGVTQYVFIQIRAHK